MKDAYTGCIHCIDDICIDEIDDRWEDISRKKIA